MDSQYLNKEKMQYLPYGTLSKIVKQIEHSSEVTYLLSDKRYFVNFLCCKNQGSKNLNWKVGKSVAKCFIGNLGTNMG